MHTMSMYLNKDDMIKDLLAEIERLRAAIEHYANPSAADWPLSRKIAREALGITNEQ